MYQCVMFIYYIIMIIMKLIRVNLSLSISTDKSSDNDSGNILIGKKVAMFSPGIEPGTFCVLDRCDNRYTTKTA